MSFTIKERLGTNVMAEITAPLNDILTDVENLVEEDIRQSLLIGNVEVTMESRVSEVRVKKQGLEPGSGHDHREVRCRG